MYRGKSKKNIFEKMKKKVPLGPFFSPPGRWTGNELLFEGGLIRVSLLSMRKVKVLYGRFLNSIFIMTSKNNVRRYVLYGRFLCAIFIQTTFNGFMAVLEGNLLGKVLYCNLYNYGQRRTVSKERYTKNILLSKNVIIMSTYMRKLITEEWARAQKIDTVTSQKGT